MFSALEYSLLYYTDINNEVMHKSHVAHHSLNYMNPNDIQLYLNFYVIFLKDD